MGHTEPIYVFPRQGVRGKRSGKPRGGGGGGGGDGVEERGEGEGDTKQQRLHCPD